MNSSIQRLAILALQRSRWRRAVAAQRLKLSGTVRWHPPELFKRGAVNTQATDVYSYGMILWEIASRKLPFSDATK